MPLTLLDDSTTSMGSWRNGGRIARAKGSTRSRLVSWTNIPVSFEGPFVGVGIGADGSTEYTIDDGKGGKIHVNVRVASMESVSCY